MSKQNHSLGSLLVAGAATCLIAASLLSSGAPAGRTGAPGDLTCADGGCHVSNAVNSGDGSVVIEAPATFEMGSPVELVVRTSKPGAARFGFQITVRDAQGAMSGSFEVTDGTQFADFGLATAYLTHAASAPRASDTYEWTIRWIPPSEQATDVTFYAAGNAANGDDTSFNDFIYTTSKEVKFAGDTALEKDVFPSRLELLSAYPNPANQFVSIEFNLAAPSTVNSFLYDGVGRVVSQSMSSFLPVGENEVQFSTSSLPSGMYSYRIEASGHSRTGLITVVH